MAKQPYHLTLTTEVRDALRAQAKNLGLSISELADHAMRPTLGLPPRLPVESPPAKPTQ